MHQPGIKGTLVRSQSHHCIDVKYLEVAMPLNYLVHVRCVSSSHSTNEQSLNFHIK